MEAELQRVLDRPDYGQYNAGHPTAQQVVDRERLTGQLTDKVILLTGASSGLGMETARVLHATGAHLFLAVRDMKTTEKVKQDILDSSSGQSSGQIELMQLDMSSLDSVRQCAAAFLANSKQLNVLICNAGVMGVPEGKTKDGFETHLGVNHLAHFLLFQLLKGALLSSSTPSFNSRVVMLSSSGHMYSPVLFDDLDLSKRVYDPFVAYGQSKTANAHMALEIERRYGSRGLHSTAVHPGVIPTPLGRHLPPAILQQMASDESVRNMKTPGQGAATTVWAAVSRDWEGRGGKYLNDVAVAKPKEQEAAHNKGYAPHLYDADAAQRLWTESSRMVGIVDEQEA